MPEYYDKNGLILDGKRRWLEFMVALENQALEYDRALKILDSSIELKTYQSTRRIVSYQLKEGYIFKSSEKGKVTHIINKDTGEIIITKVLSEEELNEKIMKQRRRKKKEFIDKALANASIWSHWCTLTFSPEIADDASYSYIKAKDAFMKWRKSIVRKYKCKIKYMAIAEYGEKNGRIHWHVLLHFDNSITFKQAKSEKGKSLFLMTRNGRNVLDENNKSIPKLIIPNWKYGIADFYPIYNTPQKAVNYMAKYMTKSNAPMPHEEQADKSKSYLSSKNLNKPRKEYYLDETESSLLSSNDQKRLELATPTFKLLNATEEVMRKTEAIIDTIGTIHTLKKETFSIDIAKNHQSKPLTESTDD